MSVGSGTTQTGRGAALGCRGEHSVPAHGTVPSCSCCQTVVITPLSEGLCGPSVRCCGLARRTAPGLSLLPPLSRVALRLLQEWVDNTEDLTSRDSDTSVASKRWCLDILSALVKPRLLSPSSLASHYASPSFLAALIGCRLLLSPASCWTTHQSRVAFLAFLICITGASLAMLLIDWRRGARGCFRYRLAKEGTEGECEGCIVLTDKVDNWEWLQRSSAHFAVCRSAAIRKEHSPVMREVTGFRYSTIRPLIFSLVYLGWGFFCFLGGRLCVCVCVCVCVCACVRACVRVCSAFLNIFLILYVNCFGMTLLYMCIEYHI